MTILMGCVTKVLLKGIKVMKDPKFHVYKKKKKKKCKLTGADHATKCLTAMSSLKIETKHSN